MTDLTCSKEHETRDYYPDHTKCQHHVIPETETSCQQIRAKSCYNIFISVESCVGDMQCRLLLYSCHNYKNCANRDIVCNRDISDKVWNYFPGNIMALNCQWHNLSTQPLSLCLPLYSILWNKVGMSQYVFRFDVLANVCLIGGPGIYLKCLYYNAQLFSKPAFAPIPVDQLFPTRVHWLDFHLDFYNMALDLIL